MVVPDSTSRRTLLRALGAAGTGTLAGCSGFRTDSRLTVDAAPTPEELGVVLGVSVHDGISAESPAMLRIWCEPKGNVATRLVFGALPPFSGLVGESSGSATLWLSPMGPGESPPATNDDSGACWRAGPYEPKPVENSATVGADGFERRYLVYATHDNDPCIPADTYRFTSSEYGVSGGPTGVEWSFKVTVTETIRG